MRGPNGVEPLPGLLSFLAVRGDVDDAHAEETLSTLELSLVKRVVAIQRGRERLGSSDERAQVR